MKHWILPVLVTAGCLGLVWARMPAPVDTSGLEAQIAALQQEVGELRERPAVREAPAGSDAPGLITRPGPSVADLERKVREVEDQIVELRRVAAQRPVAPRKARPKPAGTPDPAVVDKWIEKLRDENPEVVFTATIELGKSKDARSIPALLEVFRKHTDLWPRLGAATSLGDLRAADAVDDLVDGLMDKEELVRSASANAHRGITGKDFGYVQGLSEDRRRAMQEAMRSWWRDNERDVRERLARVK